MGASAVVVVGGGVLLYLAANDIDQVETVSDGSHWADIDEAYDRAPLLSTAGAIMVGVGVAGTAACLIWVLDGDEASSPALTVAANPAGLRVSGQW